LVPLQESRQNLDPVRPGEQWFCYWKTSAALWEAKIQELPPEEVLFIPLYWGLHAEKENHWDFGALHPERDLIRLMSILTQYRRKFIWLLPLSPAPMLPNGGLPISAARTLSMNHDGIHLSCLDQDSTLNKMYSFYAPKVYQAYASFMDALRNLFKQQDCRAPIWGVEFFYRENDQFISFFEDHSFAFEQGFSRYLKNNFPTGIDLNSPKTEQQLKGPFTSEAAGLFLNLAQETLGQLWRGKKDIVVLGGSPRDTLERSLGSGKSQFQYFQDLFASICAQRWFSTSLLTKKEKSALLKRCLGEHFNNHQTSSYFDLLSAPDVQENFQSFAAIDIFDLHRPEVFEKNGLKHFLSQHFRWIFNLHSELFFTPEWIDSTSQRVKFFHSHKMERDLFSKVLKLFLMGQRVVLDRSSLSDELEKRLNIFFLENNLQVQVVNFITEVTISELGEGRLILFRGDQLESSHKQLKFWPQLLRFLNVSHLKVEADQDIFSLWRIRPTTPHELNYLDVRRVNFYNPTSYKKIVKVQTQKKFAFMKIIDPFQAHAKTTPEGVEVELLPHGDIALEFGHYEEGDWGS
jgi:hypothetical protein